ncbi:MAG: translation initiation factor IF-2 [Chloroflexi bacterium]|nr:translation initiation factor IF-2 [Chloroflexota bacterium]MDA1298364.1 translation initiation factor IF-2 [Chloroflexota bacterium]
MARRTNPGSRRGRRRQGPSDRDQRGSSAVAVAEAPTGPVELPATLSVGELADILHKSHVDTIKALMRNGVMATVNEVVEFDVAARVAALFEIPVLKPRERAESTAARRVGIDEEMSEENSQPRPPIITVLGHVDHGKTTLLDAIRGAKVVDSEAGGITQSIGAYQVIKNGHPITFIDTPGHEAFTAMRASGAQVTDIAVLVVAADDGVMPQTREAIDHARAAGVPIVVVINKMDSPGADLDRVKGELAEQEVIVEDYGGDVVAIPVSALKKEGIDELLESLLLVAELQELKANPDRPGIGVVIEAHTDRVRGSIATVLVRSGTVRIGDNFVAGTERGRVRAMLDGFGKSIEAAGPSTPIQIMGLSGLPAVGDQLDVVEDEKAARTLVEARERLHSRRDERGVSTMADVMRRVHTGEAKLLNVIIKAGTQGSVDAVRRAVEQLSTEDVQVKVIHASAGQIGESDILLASASEGLIVGFETSVDQSVQSQALLKGVVVKNYDIIYNLVDDVNAAVHGLIEPVERRVITGHANVLDVFTRGKREKIAGVRVTDGVIRRSAKIRVLRRGDELFDGAIVSLRHLKENVRDLANNFEGGLILDGFHDYERDDVLEAYEITTS